MNTLVAGGEAKEVPRFLGEVGERVLWLARHCASHCMPWKSRDNLLCDGLDPSTERGHLVAHRSVGQRVGTRRSSHTSSWGAPQRSTVVDPRVSSDSRVAVFVDGNSGRDDCSNRPSFWRQDQGVSRIEGRDVFVTRSSPSPELLAGLIVDDETKAASIGHFNRRGTLPRRGTLRRLFRLLLAWLS